MKNTSAMKTFCDKLRELLSANGWTVQDAADRCGIERSSLSRILNGHENVTLERAAKIAKQLGSHLSDLVDDRVTV